MNRSPSRDPALAVAVVALAQPERCTGRRFALVMADGSCITFTRARDARALVWREKLIETSLPELLRLTRNQ